MQSKIEYSPRALKDLDEIWDYIENELCNPSAAQNTVEGIMDAVDSLAMFPESGAKVEFDNLHEKRITTSFVSESCVVSGNRLHEA